MWISHRFSYIYGLSVQNVEVDKVFPTGTSRDEMVALQHEVANRATFSGDNDAETVAGVDQAFKSDEVISAAAIFRDGETVETAIAVRETRMPYVPGLLAFREGRAVVASLNSLETTPDVVLVDGSGRIHPRQAGLATHAGVALSTPTVGVAKSLLCGTLRRSVERLDEGERVPVLANDEVDVPDDTVIGYAVQTKQYSEDASTTVNPLYVSPGHRVNAETAVDIAADACDDYKLPEPVRHADTLADESK